ncbi:MAG TPA: hypothetical protein PLD39_08815 [Flexilinea sp.]|nr:hypothetical protein [Flexilinea sp.]
MESFDDFKSQILAILGDENRKRFSDEMLKTGLRSALTDYDRYCPCVREIISSVEAIDEQTFTVLPQPTANQQLYGILWIDPATKQIIEPSFIATPSDSGLRIRPDRKIPLSVGDPISLRVREAHSIQGLDSSAITSVPIMHRSFLCEGAAGYALQVRASAITEVFGKRPEDSARLLQLSRELLDRFHAVLADLSRTGGEWAGAVFPSKGFEI